MKCIRLFVLLCGVSSAVPAAAQDAVAVWKAVSDAPFDPSKSASVKDLVLERDHIRITLTDGVIQFSQPAAGIIFGAAFQGHGRLQVAVPNEREAQQLRLFTKQDGLDMEFTEASFSFSDDTFDEVAKQVHWTPASTQLGELYQKRQNEREVDRCHRQASAAPPAACRDRLSPRSELSP